MNSMDLYTLDELLLQLYKHAEIIEKMISNTRITSDTILSLTNIVTDSRHELIVLLGLRDRESLLGDGRIRQVLDLVERYGDLEGALKEMRNDLYKRDILANQAKK